MAASRTVGFIGIGIMGRGMAMNLLKSGANVVVWNRTKSKLDELVAKGALVADSPKAVVQQSDITYSMLSTPAVAHEIFYSPTGTLEGMSAGKRLVDCATLDPATMVKFHSEITQKGGKFLEAPVSGSKVQAENGDLIMLCAGDKEVFDEIVETDLKLVGKASFFLGDIGAGSRMKLVVNMVMGDMMVAFSEGMHLSNKAGLDPATLVEILGLGAMAAPLYKVKGPGMVARDFKTQFPLKHQHKDMKLALDLAKEVGATLPVATAAEAAFASARPELDDEDFSAVVRKVDP
eukprot:m.481953 g.481953  ORF g.481953 m.481953 type:complete len:291 (-) comp21720_c0_seq1:261-1133(-)